MTRFQALLCTATIALLTGLAAFPSTATAMDADFSPFPDRPRTFPLTAYRQDTLADTIAWAVLFRAPADRPDLPDVRTAHGDEEAGTIDRVELLRHGDQSVIATAPIVFPGLTGVWSGDLDRNGHSDIVLVSFSIGCGLGAERTTTYLMMGSEKGYSTLSWSGFHGGPDDFVDLDGDGISEVVVGDFRFGVRGTDGHAHNYWCYDLYQFRDGTLRPVRGPGERFPALIAYKRRRNHADTKELTSSQRVLWNVADRPPARTGHITRMIAGSDGRPDDVEIRDSAGNLVRLRVRHLLDSNGHLIDSSEEPSWFRAFRPDDFGRLFAEGRTIQVWEGHVYDEGWRPTTIRVGPAP